MSDFYRYNVRQLSLYIVHNYTTGVDLLLSFTIAINVDIFCQITLVAHCICQYLNRVEVSLIKITPSASGRFYLNQTGVDFNFNFI